MASPSPPTMNVNGALTTVTPDMLRASSEEPLTDDVVKSVKDARAATVRTLLDIRLPQKELPEDLTFDSNTWIGEGQKEPPLMHFGFAMSWKQVIACLKRHDALKSIAFNPKLKTKDLHRHLGLADKTRLRDHLLMAIAFKTHIEFSLNECLTPKGVCVVISLYTNYSKGLDEWSADENRHREVVNAVRDFLQSKTYDADKHLSWYWDARWCGLGYSAPNDTYNPWPAADNGRWRTHFDDRSPDEGRARRTLDAKGNYLY
ncbi:unnamed protein product [Peniophora sp. CBMAI 1063]|nr:unnamed protein product [Peniophora sp. CBMAI 1063]